MSTTTSDSITPQQAQAALADGTLVIDVRSDAGRTRDGRIEGAVVVAKSDLKEALDLHSAKHLPEFTDQAQPVVLICGSENGTQPFLGPLRDAGLKNVVQVSGGVTAWKEQGLPTTPVGE